MESLATDLRAKILEFKDDLPENKKEDFNEIISMLTYLIEKNQIQSPMLLDFMEKQQPSSQTTQTEEEENLYCYATLKSYRNVILGYGIYQKGNFENFF